MAYVDEISSSGILTPALGGFTVLRSTPFGICAVFALRCDPSVMTDHRRVGFEMDRIMRVGKSNRGMRRSPVRDRMQAPRSKLDVPLDQVGVDAKGDVIKLDSQLSSLPDFVQRVS